MFEKVYWDLNIMLPFLHTDAYKKMKNNNSTNKANQQYKFFMVRDNLNLVVETNSKEKTNNPFIHLNVKR